MEVVRYDTPQQFKDAVFPFLLQKEAIHNVQLGVISNWLQFPGRYEEAYLVSLHEDSEMVGTAIMTLPHPLQVSDMDLKYLDVLIDDLYVAYPTTCGVNGPVSIAEAFAQKWTARTGRAHRLEIRQGLYQLQAVTMPLDMPGHLREATSADVPLLGRWIQAFSTEALEETPPLEETIKGAERRISHPDAMLYVWDVDGQVVSMAGVSGPTQNGIRVNAVYTPPENRGKGYASACVATLSQRMLDTGRRYCFLYTDLANPTSNSIYKKMGYQQLCDMSYYRFEASEG